ncbi:BTB/POZ domain-containing protein [Actinidia chinensis var. chinensis]|uniref:BTB/POZ domain-containing protein n=1 Tax=Actinidia chinensis var. chinensis TaxID=1590841 RepID=A0A2R6S173_ACTCC|nr:BTB/POZ domain-containing protein [Actinidia chinensis var. chinensis]
MMDLNDQQVTPPPTTPTMFAKKMELLSTAMKRTSEWIFSQEVSSDVTIHAGGTSFSLHKFPLISKCGYIRKLVSESSEADRSTLELSNVPGGEDAFELAAKFCYGINFEISIENIAMLRCVAEYLDMTEDAAVGNLVGRTEAYLNEVVLKSLASTISILHSSENLLPIAEEVKLVSRCVDTIAYMACEDSQFCKPTRAEICMEGVESSLVSEKNMVAWWAEDLTVLKIDFFQRVLIAMMARGFKQHALGPILGLYAQNSFRELESFGNGRKKIQPRQEHEKRVVVETIVSLLPREKNAVSAHPDLSDAERKKVCSAMNCQKLSREACAHAAQNDRLPVQTVVQVLYLEQLRLREAMTGNLTGSESPALLSPITNLYKTDFLQAPDDLSGLKRENQELKLELVKTKMRLKEVEKPPIDGNKSPLGSSSESSLSSSADHKSRMPRKSFISTISKKLGKLYPFLRVDGVSTPGDRIKRVRDRRHSTS